jgi:6-pyruvoyltetrahydropterin/6-carboxytetrahydropterin synthase
MTTRIVIWRDEAGRSLRYDSGVSGWVLEVAGRFEAAHRLYSWHGREEPTHGHSWRVVARLASSRLDEEGMAFDFVAVRDALGALTARFDHRDINTVAPFDRESPTTERLARWFYEELARALPEAPFVAVTLFEGPDCSATFTTEEESR